VSPKSLDDEGREAGPRVVKWIDRTARSLVLKVMKSTLKIQENMRHGTLKHDLLDVHLTGADADSK
jgi:hypothetical protein